MGVSRVFAADGLEPLEVSAPAVMRGGADVAAGDTALSQIESPASISLHDSRKLDFTGQAVHSDNHWSGPIDSAFSELTQIRHVVFVGFRFSW